MERDTRTLWFCRIYGLSAPTRLWDSRLTFSRTIRSGPESRVCSERFWPELKNLEPNETFDSEKRTSGRSGATWSPPTGSEGSGPVVLDFNPSTDGLPVTLRLKSHLIAHQLGSAETRLVPFPFGLALMTSSRMRNIFHSMMPPPPCFTTFMPVFRWLNFNDPVPGFRGGFGPDLMPSLEPTRT